MRNLAKTLQKKFDKMSELMQKYYLEIRKWLLKSAKDADKESTD